MKYFFYLLTVLPLVGAEIKISDLTIISSPSTNTFIEVADLDATPKSRKYLLSNLLPVSGTVVNSGTPVDTAVPIYSGTTGTNIIPSSVTVGSLTNLTVPGKLTISSGTVTADTPLFDSTQTWNSSGVTFTGLKLNITDTASAAASKLLDLQIGGSSKFAVSKAGAVLGADGSKTVPTYSFGSATGLGWYTRAGFMMLGFGGFEVMQVDGSRIRLLGEIGFGAGGSDLSTTAADTFIVRDAANTLALRNGANAQVLRIYSGYADAANYSRLAVGFSGGNAVLFGQGAGTGGSGPNIQVGYGGTAQMMYASSGVNLIAPLLFYADNTYDIGAPGATRPRNVHVAGSVTAAGAIVAGGSGFQLSASATYLQAPSDGIAKFVNSAGTDFSRLQFGGTTASFPSLKRSSATLVARLADDSADARFTANDYTMSKTITAAATTGDQTINKASGSVNFAAAAQTITVTCSLVDANSVIMATVATDDATAFACKAIPGSGSFVLKLNAAATAETRVNFLITN